MDNEVCYVIILHTSIMNLFYHDGDWNTYEDAKAQAFHFFGGYEIQFGIIEPDYFYVRANCGYDMGYIWKTTRGEFDIFAKSPQRSRRERFSNKFISHIKEV